MTVLKGRSRKVRFVEAIIRIGVERILHVTKTQRINRCMFVSVVDREDYKNST